MKLLTALGGAAVSALAMHGLMQAWDTALIIAMSRRRFVDTVALADDPVRFWLSVGLHAAVALFGAWILLRALTERR